MNSAMACVENRFKRVEDTMKIHKTITNQVVNNQSEKIDHLESKIERLQDTLSDVHRLLKQMQSSGNGVTIGSESNRRFSQIHDDINLIPGTRELGQFHSGFSYP